MNKLSIPVTAEDHMQGDIATECSLVEYGDYECPYCGEVYPIIKEIQRHFGNRLCFVFRNFPLAQMHPWAESAAEVAEFAGAHGKFWEMHDLLYKSQESMGDDLFPHLALELALSTAELQNAIAHQTYSARVRADFMGGIRSGVSGTPMFFINGHRHDGSFEFRSLSTAIEHSLSVHKR